MRRFIIKLLIRLLDRGETYKDINVKFIDQWLVRQYQDMGFREYFRRRDLQILKTIGLGLDQENYWIHLGQRLELLKLLEKVGQAWTKEQKRQQKLINDKKNKK